MSELKCSIDPSEAIKLESSKDGWFIVTADKKAGPFKYFSELNANKLAALAKELVIDYKALWKAVFRVEASLEETKPTSGLKTSIQLDQKTITMDFTGQQKRIHPAIDFDREKRVAHIGVWIPCTITYKPKREGGEPEIREEDLFFLVTSNREMILADQAELRKHGLRLSYEPLPKDIPAGT